MTTESYLPFDDLVWACTNLCELLEVENEALSRHDATTVRDLAENKAALARVYEQSVEPMNDDPELVDALDEDQRDELKALGGRLAQLVTDNVRMLRAEMECRERLIEAIANAAKNRATNSVAYSRAGAFEIPTKSSDRPSVALNKTF
jgi:hypothetical protein